MARKGARVVLEPGQGLDRPRQADDRAASATPPDAWEPEVWVQNRDPEPAAQQRATPRRRRTGSAGADTSPPSRTGSAASAKDKAERRLADAARAYEADRYADARRLLRPLVEGGDAPPAVRELHGLTLYRMGKWSAAIEELKIFGSMTGSLDQLPVLADCHRALGHWKAVDELWDEIRQASPSPEVVAEGRIVAAGALADQGNVTAALQLLDRATTKVQRPGLHHLRMWYARADLYERAGEIPRARELFRAILGHDPDFVDTAERLAALD